MKSATASLLSDHLPPQSLEAEQAVLGAALISQSAARTVVETLRRGDFYVAAHRHVYDAIAALTRRDQPVDVLTVPEELKRLGKLDQIGGLAYISTLAESVPTAAHVEYYARTVIEKSALRLLINAAGEVTAAAHEQQDAVPAIAEQAVRTIRQASDRILSIDSGGEDDIRPLAVNLIEAVLEKRPEPAGISTGLARLDKATYGWQNWELHIVAARPGVGKTAFMLHCALQAGFRNIPVLIFSLEMSRPSLMSRLTANVAGLNSNKLREKEYLSDDEASAFASAAAKVGDLPLFIRQVEDLGMDEIRGRARKWRENHPGRCLVAIDYFQRIRWPHGMNENNALEYNAEACKSMARELGCPVLTLSQLTRANERRDDKRPQLHDLRGSGGIEQAADTVWFLYRDKAKETKAKEETGMKVWPCDVELLIEKMRLGEAGQTIKLLYDGPTGRFTENDDPYSFDVAAPPERGRRDWE